MSGFHQDYVFYPALLRTGKTGNPYSESTVSLEMSYEFRCGKSRE